MKNVAITILLICASCATVRSARQCEAIDYLGTPFPRESLVRKISVRQAEARNTEVSVPDPKTNENWLRMKAEASEEGGEFWYYSNAHNDGVVLIRDCKIIGAVPLRVS